MYEQIKELADKAIEVQNKLGMELALREISALCDGTGGESVEVLAGEDLESGDAVVVTASNAAKAITKKASKK